MNPKRLMEKARLGDKESFGKLYSEYYVPVFRYIYLRINNKEEAEDMAQTVFLKVYQSIGSYKNTDADPLAYFFTVARNIVIDFYRKKKTLSLEGSEQFLEIEDGKKDLEESLTDKEDQELVRSALSSLPDDQREIIILKFINELSNSEIAKLLGKNEPAIRQIQHRALKNLQNIIERKS